VATELPHTDESQPHEDGVEAVTAEAKGLSFEVRALPLSFSTSEEQAFYCRAVAGARHRLRRLCAARSRQTSSSRYLQWRKSCTQRCWLRATRCHPAHAPCRRAPSAWPLRCIVWFASAAR